MHKIRLNGNISFLKRCKGKYGVKRKGRTEVTLLMYTYKHTQRERERQAKPPKDIHIMHKRSAATHKHNKLKTTHSRLADQLITSIHQKVHKKVFKGLSLLKYFLKIQKSDHSVQTFFLLA